MYGSSQKEVPVICFEDMAGASLVSTQLSAHKMSVYSNAAFDGSSLGLRVCFEYSAQGNGVRCKRWGHFQSKAGDHGALNS